MRVVKHGDVRAARSRAPTVEGYYFFSSLSSLPVREGGGALAPARART